MKKILLVLITFVLLTTMLASCANAPEERSAEASAFSYPAESKSTGDSYYAQEGPTYAPAEEAYSAYDAAPPVTGGYTPYDTIEPFYPAPENSEEYSYIEESGFLSSVSNPLSTFAADVDTASYANVRRYLSTSSTVPQDAVKIEEMVNYFDYGYEKPVNGEPFAVTTELAPCPWNVDAHLLSVGLSAMDIEPASVPSNLVFLIDVSGSMDEPAKLPLIKRSFSLLCDNLSATDRVSIVTYAGHDSIVLAGASGDDPYTIRYAIDELSAGGSTAGASAIESAYRLARENYIEGGNNRIILATDGDFNVGASSEAELSRLITGERETGVYLSVLGLGDGNIKDNRMSALAREGNGNYYYIDTPLEARKVLVEEMGGTLYTIAKDVKFQIEFNPAQIAGYRLIGYEDRRLNAEDFDDDKKDAGEIGAGHKLTALYEIIPANGSTEDISAPALKYQTATTNSSDELMTIKIRYKHPAGEESSLVEIPVTKDVYSPSISDDLSFAAGVAEMGMLLRGSEFAGNASFAKTYERLSSIGDAHEDPYKSEFLNLLRQAANIY